MNQNLGVVQIMRNRKFFQGGVGGSLVGDGAGLGFYSNLQKK